MKRGLPSILIVVFSILCFAVPSSGVEPDLKSAQFKSAVLSIIRENPSAILDSFKGREDQLYDLMQRGLELKKRKLILERRRNQLSNPLIPRSQPERPVFGNPAGDIKITAYYDLQTAECARADKILQKVIKMDPMVSVQYRHNPLGLHEFSLPAARMYEACCLQSKDAAFKFLNMIFDNRSKVYKNGRPEIISIALEAGADKQKVLRDAASPRIQMTINDDITEAKKFGFTASPVFIVNGIVITGYVPVEDFIKTIDIVRKYSQ